jgi:hypothetical protein
MNTSKVKSNHPSRWCSRVMLVGSLIGCAACGAKSSVYARDEPDGSDASSARTTDDMDGSVKASSDKDSSDKANQVNFDSFEEYVDAYTKELCAYLERCAGVVPEELARYCGLGSEALYANLGIDLGKLRLDSDKGARCLEGLRGQRCAQHWLAPTECFSASMGTLELDAACVSSAECEPGLFCERTNQCPGVCQLSANAGQTCGTRECAKGLFCLDNTCVAPSQEGEACTETRCDLHLSCVEGVCRGYRAFSRQLAEPCEESLECYGNNYCESSTNTCVLRASVGERCDDLPCNSDGYCRDGTCRAKQRDGEACSSSTDCESAGCVQARCHERLALGAACARSSECSSGRCNTAGICVTAVSCDPSIEAPPL